MVDKTGGWSNYQTDPTPSSILFDSWLFVNGTVEAGACSGGAYLSAAAHQRTKGRSQERGTLAVEAPMVLAASS